MFGVGVVVGVPHADVRGRDAEGGGEAVVGDAAGAMLPAHRVQTGIQDTNAGALGPLDKPRGDIADSAAVARVALLTDAVSSPASADLMLPAIADVR